MKGAVKEMGSAPLPEGYLRKGEKLFLTLEEVVNPQYTALIIVDVQNDFVYGRGKLSTARGTANPCEQILAPLSRSGMKWLSNPSELTMVWWRPRKRLCKSGTESNRK